MGWATKRDGGKSSVTTTKKGWGHKRLWGSFDVGLLSLAILKEEAKGFQPFKGARTVLPCLQGGQKVSVLRFSHFVAPLPVINDRSLIMKGGLCHSMFKSPLQKRCNAHTCIRLL